MNKAELERKLANKVIDAELSGIILFLQRLPPNGAKVHRKNGNLKTLELLRATADNYKASITFKEYKSMYKEMYEELVGNIIKIIDDHKYPYYE